MLKSQPEKFQNIYCLRGQKNLVAPSAPRNNPISTLIVAFYGNFKTKIVEKNIEIFCKSNVPKLLLFIAFIRNISSEKLLKIFKRRLRRQKCVEISLSFAVYNEITPPLEALPLEKALVLPPPI